MKTLILKLTHRLWNERIVAIMFRLNREKVIDDAQLHAILSKFDPTQIHEVY